MDLNKAMIIGHLTRDPEVRTTPSGLSVANFGVATNLVWKDQAGQKQEKVEFHNVVAWRRLAETIGQYLKKGSKVYIEGRLQTRTWDDKETDKKMYRTEIIADNMIMLDRAPSSQAPTGEAEPASQGEQPAPANDYSQPETPTTQKGANQEEEINVEDIPF